MKPTLNPILKKDIRVTSRSSKLSLSLLLYEGVLLLVLLFALLIINAESNSYYRASNFYSSVVYIFPVLAIMQTCIVALITPILTASSISGEREKQTFDIMLTTCMSPLSIITGKVMTAVARVLLYIIASIPIMGLPFVLGGMSWFTLLGYILCMIILAIFAGSIGIFCSAICNKSITSVILSFIFYFLVIVMTVIPFVIEIFATRGNVYDSLIFLLFNPIVLFIEFFMLSLTGQSLFGGLNGREAVLYDGVDGVISQLLMHGMTWLILSGVCVLLLSFLFMLGAAKSINPLYQKKEKKAKKKKQAEAAE